MCGITGFWKTRGLADNDPATLGDMITRLHHRGPDGQGTHLDRENGLALGHARLSIIDLAGGHQPLYTAGKNLVLTANGEFYDYKRIRSRLMADGARFATKSDSEIALALYQRHGMDMMPHLRGEFAFALHDQKEETLFLVRDRFGIKPLFYHVRDGAVYWASEVKSLTAHPDIPARIDRKALLNQLMHTMVPGTSAFEGIRAVRPGHMLVVKRRGDSFDIEERRWWDIDFPRAKDRDASAPASEHVNRIRERLVDSVAFRLEADVPVGCYLSGGIDSCSILGLATGAQQSPVKAFTIAFDHADYDESIIAREMAESMKAEQDMIRVKAADLYGENYERTMWHAERTFYNTLGVAKWCMSRHVYASGYKTVVTGEGSDELFGGYPSFKLDMFLHGLKDEPADVVEEMRRAMDKSNQLFKGAILAEQQASHPAFEDLCGFTPSWIQPWMATLKLARPLLRGDIRDELADYDPVAEIAGQIDPSQLESRHPLDKAQYTWMKTMLEGQILNWGGDRVDMANSMESRPAFLDHHVAEAARLVPPGLRIRGNIEKWVLREAMKGVLPETLYKREKFAFMAPPGHTEPEKVKALGKLIDRWLAPGQVEEAGMLDPERVTAFLADYRTDQDPVSLTRKDALLNHLLGLQILHHQFVAGNAPAREPSTAATAIG